MKTDIAELTAEIDEINRALGWRETTPSFSEAMMLLVTECAEAADAWREHGLADVSYRLGNRPDNSGPVKPQGVGSEFADIAIRLLDDCAIFGLVLDSSGLEPDELDSEVSLRDGRLTITLRMHAPGSMLEAMMALTRTISMADKLWEDGHRGLAGQCITVAWLQLRYFALMFSVDLDKEIRRKLDYNRTRERRHGGKRL